MPREEKVASFLQQFVSMNFLSFVLNYSRINDLIISNFFQLLKMFRREAFYCMGTNLQLLKLGQNHRDLG